MHYPLIIIWTGSAGLPAGMYASRYGIRNLIIGAQPGGALATSHCVENYPGTISESGGSIMKRFEEHAKHAWSEVLYDTVISIMQNAKGKMQNDEADSPLIRGAGKFDARSNNDEKMKNENWESDSNDKRLTINDKLFIVKTASHWDYSCDYLIYATGNAYRHLDVPGEDRLLGAGVSYCATCDGNFFKGRDVIVVGGGDSAFTEALYLAQLCKTVTILVRKERAKAEEVWVNKVAEQSNMTVLYNTEVAEINGQFSVESVTTKDGRTLPTQGIFIAVGSVPSVELLRDLSVASDEEGCIIIDAHQKSTNERIYAAGDVTTWSAKFRQTIMSAAEGCLAAHSVHESMLKNGVAFK